MERPETPRRSGFFFQDRKGTMQSALSTPSSASTSMPATSAAATAGLAPNALAHYQIIRRNGAVVPFEPHKIAIAMMKAVLAVHGTQGAASASVRETVDGLTQAVMRALMRSANKALTCALLMLASPSPAIARMLRCLSS